MANGEQLGDPSSGIDHLSIRKKGAKIAFIKASKCNEEEKVQIGVKVVFPL